MAIFGQKPDVFFRNCAVWGAHFFRVAASGPRMSWLNDLGVCVRGSKQSCHAVRTPPCIALRQNCPWKWRNACDVEILKSIHMFINVQRPRQSRPSLAASNCLHRTHASTGEKSPADLRVLFQALKERVILAPALEASGDCQNVANSDSERAFNNSQILSKAEKRHLPGMLGTQ